MITYEVPAAAGSVSDIVKAVQDALKKWGISSKESAFALLRIEELLNRMVLNSPDNAMLRVRVNRFAGRVSFHASCRGNAFTSDDIKRNLTFDTVLNDEENVVVQSLLEKLTDQQTRIRNIREVNICDLSIYVSEYRRLWLTLGALVLGILAGFAVKGLFSAGTVAWISENIFSLISDLFTNALKMLVGPLVFFSIAASIAEMKDIKAFGRIAGKIMLCYVMTSMLAIVVGYGVFKLIPIGDPSLQSAVSNAATATVAKADSVSVSVRELILSIIPSDIVTPFLKANMLQIIFMSVLVGLGSTALSGDSKVNHSFASAISDINNLVIKITNGVITFLPLTIFCSMAKMIAQMDLGNLMKVFLWVLVNYAGHLAMVGVYALLLLIFARLNPVKFIVKYFPAIATAFSTMSSNATLPVSMDCCDKKLGISPSIYSFSIPLGATVNMDGNCITLIITGMFAARIYGIEITSSLLLTMAFITIALSMGSPGVPGGNLVCIAVLLPGIGIPAEAASLIIGLYSLVSMTQTAVNVAGDAVVSTIVARSEKALDIDIYNS